MKKLRITEEFRVETEEEAKAAVERYQREGAEKGFTVVKWSADYKTKKAKGEIIDAGYLLKITSQFAGFWDDLEG